MIANQIAMINEISSVVTSTYQVEVADGKLSAKAISVLAETLSRVPAIKDGSTQITRKRMPTPESCYLWAIANATIVFPYVSLESAVKNMKDSLYAPKHWGYTDGKYHLPKVESTTDSPAWGLLREIILAKHGDEVVKFDADVSEQVPDLSADTCAKEPLLDTVIIRILELVRNPLSATIRRTGLEKAENVIKNAVDFIILEKIYQDREEYKNLTLSGVAITSGRRSRRVENKSTGNKVSYTTVYVGYKLAEMLCKYIHKPQAKSPEGETFVSTILAFLRSLVPGKDELDKFTLPKPLFETPSNQLRAMVREGPRIKTKKGDRHNLYVPLSFVKSAECTSYPEVARKEIIEIGSNVLKTLDEVNKFPIKRANEFIPPLKEFLSFSYALSDKCRKEWRMRAFVPSIPELYQALEGDVPSISEVEEDGSYAWSPSEFREQLASLKETGDTIPFRPAIIDPDERAALVQSINQIVTERKSKRSVR